MEGYSVTEAASVLGVPTEKVWELLARGVLAGTPDGETGMRVHLQSRVAAPVPGVPTGDTPNPANGSNDRDRSREPEGSPFRELLSEFRNLTERYGQALLALGEARGEVASLRSRVDLLEARIDLRLPSASPAPAMPAPPNWRAEPAIVEPPEFTEEPTSDVAASEAAAEAEPEGARKGRRRRGRGQHRATDDFAQALARADDPSPAELPGGSEAAAALAALHEEAARERPMADVLLPRDVAAAEPIPAAEVSSDGDSVLADEPSPAAEPIPAGEPMPPAESEPTPAMDVVASEPAPAAPAPPEMEPDVDGVEPSVADETAAADTSSGSAGAPTTADEVRDETAATGAPTWDPDRYTTSLGEPDWIPDDMTDRAAAPASPDSADEPTSAESPHEEPATAGGQQPERSEDEEPDDDGWSEILGGWEPREAASAMSGVERWPEEEDALASTGPSEPAGEWPAADAELPRSDEPATSGEPGDGPATAGAADQTRQLEATQLDAASEMEVAAEGGASDPGATTAPPAPSASTSGFGVRAAVTPPLGRTEIRPSTMPGFSAGGHASVAGGAPGTASRAYRRLRRIFPG